MKKLLLLFALILTSCGGSNSSNYEEPIEQYYNWHYHFDITNDTYVVWNCNYKEYEHTKEWVLPPSNVFYNYTSNEYAHSYFYIYKDNNYKLVVYFR